MMEPQKLDVLSELGIESTMDMYDRLTKACHKKCISLNYAESEITKGEAVCVDRCVAKFIEINDIMGKRFSAIYNQEIQESNKNQGK